MASVLRAPPCNGYEKLEHFSTIVAHHATIRACKTNECLKTWQKAKDGTKKLYGTLMTACRNAMNDMLSARTEARATEAGR